MFSYIYLRKELQYLITKLHTINTMTIKSILKTAIFSALFATFTISCSNNQNLPALNADEMAQVQKLNFDETLIRKLKGLTNKSFRTMGVENQSGQSIPEHMMPKMIYFKLAKNFDASLLEPVKSDYKKMNYNIYTVNQNDYSLTINVSKLIP